MHKKDLETNYFKFRAEIELLEKNIIEKDNDLEKLSLASTNLLNETEEFKQKLEDYKK